MDEPIEGDTFSIKHATSHESDKEAVLPSNKTETPAHPAEKEESIPEREPKIVCRFHNGLGVSGLWTCCGGNYWAPPCRSAPSHFPFPYEPSELEQFWAYHFTPSSSSTPHHRLAVAIDCEMGTSTYGEPELIRVSLIDYFTSEILIDNLVLPTVEIQHYNTRFSGITRSDMEKAVRSGNYIMGKDVAREMIWQFVNSATIVVGYAVHNDLNSLRWIHPRVIDPFLHEGKIVKNIKAEIAAKQLEASTLIDLDDHRPPQAPTPTPTPNPHSTKNPTTDLELQLSLSLKSRVKYRLGRDIQTGKGKNKGQGHDSVEDAIAARDLVHWIVGERLRDRYNG